jgi:hypothetical protein
MARAVYRSMEVIGWMIIVRLAALMTGWFIRLR